MSMQVLEVRRYGKQWCRIEARQKPDERVIEEVLERFPAGDGFSYQLYRATEARRILETSPLGVKVLAVDYALQPAELPAISDQGSS